MNDSLVTRRLVGLIASVALAIITAPPPANGQPSTKVFRIGHLHSLYPTPFHETFWQRLRDLGFVERKNLIAERRYAKGNDELLPALAAELVCLNVDVIFTSHRDPLSATEAAARSMGIQLRTLEVRGIDDFDRAFAAASTADGQALLVLSSPLFYLHRTRITEFAAKRQLPAVTQFREFADAGGLLAYGPNLHELFRSCASLTARILGGVKPADLPA